MAVLWSHRNGKTLHEVRTAGNSVRLYTNGVFHSQWNPKRLLTRSVWDSLTLAAFFLPADQLKRVLILGVGGGVVIKQLEKLFPGVEIVGVELDAMHIKIAKQWFQIDQTDATLIQADARDWLERYDGPAFDLIIDDLFGDTNGDVARAVEVDSKWSQTLYRHLSDNGVLAVNFIGRSELRQSGLFTMGRFKTRQCFTPPFCDNAVAVFAKKETPIKCWKQRVSSHRLFKPSQKKAILADKRRSF
jgi:spermidine synthase